MTVRTNVDLSKLLLVACDQSYFNYGTLATGMSLAPLPDKSSNDPAYANPDIYRDLPQFSTTSNYKVYQVMERPEIGAKAVIYEDTATKQVIVAFGGTDGLDLPDWVTNTQSVGWKQWEALVDPERGNLFGRLDALKNSSNMGGTIANIHSTGQSLGGALAQYAAYEYVRQQRRAAQQQGGSYTPSNCYEWRRAA
ncbi:MAG: hypothetical protein EFKGCFLK_02343 [Rhodocyclaceae bacterium]|nr:MAG: hypothetical protein F9K21_14900 [Rhodocyclaceae bacterium]MBV6408742.1 hypothetical protein [Rhodocyclaceae bacterium]